MSLDLTTFTEVDPNSRLSSTASTVTITGLSRDEDCYLYYDFGVDYWGGNFNLNADINITADNGRFQFALTNTLSEQGYIVTNSLDQQCFVVQWSTGAASFVIWAQEVDGGTVYNSSQPAISTSTDYYLKFRRDESVGTYGTLYLDIYTSDADRAAQTNALANLSVTLHSNKNFRYLLPVQAYDNNTGTQTMSGTVSNVTDIIVVLPSVITGTFSIPAPTITANTVALPDSVTGTFAIPIPAVSGLIIVSPSPVTGSFSIPAPDIQKVIVLPTAVTGSFTIPAPSVILPTIVLVNAVTGTFAILAPDITEIVAVMMGVSNFPQSTTVEYKITDSDGVELQAWTSVGVNEVQGPSKSAYYVKTNVIGGGIESRGIIYWRTSDLAYEASDVFDTSQSNIATLLQRLTYNRAANLDNLDAAISTRPTVTEIWDEVLTKATHNVANSAGKRLRQLSASFVHDGTAQAGGTNTITLDTGASATDYIYNEWLIVIVGGTAQGEAHHIMSYNGTTKVAVVDQNWYTQPDNTSDFVIFGSSAHDTIATGLAAGGGASTITLNGDASTLDNTYIGCYIAIPSGTGAGQARRVTGYNGTTKVATITDAWATAPDNTSVYMVYPSASTPTLSEIEGSSVLAKEATLASLQDDMTSVLTYAIGMSKWKNNKLARTSVVGNLETWVLYEDDNTTPALTWTNNTTTRTRTKAT